MVLKNTITKTFTKHHCIISGDEQIKCLFYFFWCISKRMLMSLIAQGSVSIGSGCQIVLSLGFSQSQDVSTDHLPFRNGHGTTRSAPKYYKYNFIANTTCKEYTISLVPSSIISLLSGIMCSPVFSRPR